jgi:hypothetical protein
MLKKILLVRDQAGSGHARARHAVVHASPSEMAKLSAHTSKIDGGTVI